MSSLFAAVEMAPRDPILGLNEAFNADTNPAKVNLGVGVYFGDDGKIPLLGAVKAAEKARLEPSRRAATSRSKASPPTTMRCRTCSSARIPNCSPPAAPLPANAWAAPARSKSAPTT
jgi:hypothetical protein